MKSFFFILAALGGAFVAASNPDNDIIEYNRKVSLFLTPGLRLCHDHGY
jgi:hypothetical protein